MATKACPLLHPQGHQIRYFLSALKRQHYLKATSSYHSPNLVDDLEQALAASHEDSAQMLEEERQLQEAIRLSKLEYSSSISQDQGSTSHAKEMSANLKRKAEAELSKDATKNARQGRSNSSALVVSELKMAYPNGGIRITRTPGRLNAKNCVNLKDVIHKQHLKSACVYSFFIADEELLEYLPVSRSPDAPPIYIGRDPNPDMDTVISEACTLARLVPKGKLTNKQFQNISSIAAQLYRKRYGENLHPFYAWSPGSSHTKILLLVYPTFLRLVITSCNMMLVDTELGDNHWYIHDLPKRSSRQSVVAPSFEADLLDHLQALGVTEQFLQSIRGMYDYSAIKVHLVTSVPGVSAGPKAEKYGLLRLRRVVRDLGVDLRRKRRDGALQLEVCAASIGNLSAKWLDGFYDCALGRKYLEIVDGSCDVPDIKLFYPTVGDVRNADENAQLAASNIGCHTRPWPSTPDAIKKIFHRYQSKDKGRLFHQKLIMAYDPRDSAAVPYYVYIGSANLSQSAWGALEVDKRGNDATCGLKLVKKMNFECGVVIPGDILKDLLEPGTRSWQEGIVPYVQATEPYDLGKDKPWNDPGWVVGFLDYY